MNFMTAMRFIDTNVLLYSISMQPAEAAKAEVAREILLNRDLMSSRTPPAARPSASAE